PPSKDDVAAPSSLPRRARARGTEPRDPRAQRARYVQADGPRRRYGAPWQGGLNPGRSYGTTSYPEQEAAEGALARFREQGARAWLTAAHATWAAPGPQSRSAERAARGRSLQLHLLRQRRGRVLVPARIVVALQPVAYLEDGEHAAHLDRAVGPLPAHHRQRV